MEIEKFFLARRSLLIAAAIQPDCLEMVLTRLLSARFLILDRKATECWSQLGAAVRTAMALGLHRDASNLVSMFMVSLHSLLQLPCSLSTRGMRSIVEGFGEIFSCDPQPLPTILSVGHTCTMQTVPMHSVLVGHLLFTTTIRAHGLL